MKPCLYIVIPCYNEEAVLPVSCAMFLDKLESLVRDGRVAESSRILFVDDGSRDNTWAIIQNLARLNKSYQGLRLSRNRGHQNALLAGLMEAREKCDITVSVDCDGQDDLDAMDKMVDAYARGCDVVYGVRENRDSDSFFKRTTAQGFYRLLSLMGVECVYNHADYRLLSRRALDGLAQFGEVNLFLRGLVPMVGFQSEKVYYSRKPRMAGKTHYSLGKMLALALDGITSTSIRPIRLITCLGLVMAVLSFAGAVWSVVVRAMGQAVSGWASMTCIICFIGGVQLISLGVLGEYIGKIYLEAKGRPRYIIRERTEDEE